MKQIAKKVIFTGRVQGVGFRYTAHRISGNYRVSGYVKNLANSNVEMFVQGRADEVDAMIEDICEYFSGYIREAQISLAAQDSKYKNFIISYY